MATGKILFLVSAAYPLGGVATWLESMLVAMSERGWRCRLCLTTGHFCDSRRYLAIHPWQDTVTCHNNSGSREGRIRAIKNVLRNERPDVLIVINTPDAYIAASRIKKDRPKVIMALHGLEPQFYRDIEEYRSVIDAVVVPSKLAVQLARLTTAYPPNRVFQIPAGVEFRDIEIIPTVKPLHIVYSGRLVKDAKRVDDIPPILRILDQRRIEYRMSIAGEGPERVSLETQLTGLRGEVLFLGALSKQQLFDQVYTPGRLLLVTSERETGPLVAWEAMASGMALVCSKYRGLKAENMLLNETNSLLFPVGDHEAAAAGLCRLQDEQFSISIVRAGMELVRAKFSMDLMASHWFALLSELSDRNWRQKMSRPLEYPPDGRLARAFGHGIAERVRAALGCSYQHDSAGGEWPHSYNSPEPSKEYWKAVQAVESAC